MQVRKLVKHVKQVKQVKYVDMETEYSINYTVQRYSLMVSESLQDLNYLNQSKPIFSFFLQE